MQTHEPKSPAANADDDRRAFWDDVMGIAVRGVEQPERLTPEQVQRLCRLVLIGMAKRPAPRPT